MFKAFKNDADLWIAVRNDDERAFNVLFERYWDRLYKIIFPKLRNEEESLEVVHDIFLSLWHRRHTLEIELFSNYLLMCARYQIYSRQKPAKLSISYKSELEDFNDFSELNSVEEQIDLYDLQRKLNFHLTQLPKRCQEIFRLSRIEHLSNTEIAQHLGITKKSVENQLTTALKYLRTVLKKVVSIALFLVFNRFL